jgi:hypothetical protein
MRREMTRLFLPHVHAERLMDAKRDSESLSAADAAWLDAHTRRCPRCTDMAQARERLAGAMKAMRGTKAPEGFAGRVLFAAKTRKVADPGAGLGDERPMMSFAQLAIGGVLALLVVGGLAGMIAISSTSNLKDPPASFRLLPFDSAGGGRVSPAAKIGTSGGAAVKLGDEERPHFLVRAPGIGAAKTRSQVTQILAAHGGTFRDAGGVLVARIPRPELIGVTQDIAKSGRYKMSKVDDGDLPASLDTIVIRFELE